MTEMLQPIGKEVRMSILNILHVLNKVEKKMIMVKRKSKDRKNIQMELPEKKNIISDIKNTLDGLKKIRYYKRKYQCI